MKRLLFHVLVFSCTLVASPAAAADAPLTGGAAALYKQAQKGKFYSTAEKLHPQILPTSDGRSLLAVWKASKAPSHWIVALHGTQGFATDELAIWSANLKGRDVGLVCLQWWLGSGDRADSYYSPTQVYREIDVALRDLRIASDRLMLQGFSRGSSNSYAVAALDAGAGGKHYFSLFVASSGGAGLDYPPTRSIVNGEYGPRPLAGTQWVTAAGARDPHPDRDGIQGMRQTAQWLKEQGASVVLAIEDSKAGHGALQMNGNLRRVLDLFLKK